MEITNKDIRRYEHAQRLALKHNAFGKFRMICTAYRGNKLLYVGANYYPTRRSGETIAQLYAQIGCHAEARTIYALSHTVRCAPKISIYIAGFNQNNTAIVSKPCPRCLLFIAESSIVKQVVYYDGLQLVKTRSNELELLPIPKYNERRVV